MREIKFRAWDSKYKLMRLDTTYAMSFDGTVKLLSKYEDNASGQYHSCGNGIIPMQYTGLDDCNGVPIYEGDIVKTKSSHYGQESENTNRVGWDDESYSWALYGFYGRSLDEFYDYEVIGNRYEHPHLLEGGDV